MCNASESSVKKLDLKPETSFYYRTNTLAYYEHLKIEDVKIFITLAPGCRSLHRMRKSSRTRKKMILSIILSRELLLKGNAHYS